MPAKETVEEKLTRLAELARAPITPEGAAELRKLLSGTNNVVAEQTARIMGASGQAEFIPALCETCLRLLQQPAAADKTCRAKVAIVHALEALDNVDPQVYLTGMRHIQMEPVYGGRTDTAGTLRGDCALALARMRYHDTHFALMPLLVDAEVYPRVSVVKGLIYLASEKSELLLRMKILMGEDNAEVLAECFTGLLELEPDRSLPFISAYLSSPMPQYAEQAALALGNLRSDDAFAALRACWEANTDLGFRRTLLLALALTRRDEAFELLLHVVRDDGRTAAVLAVEALALYATDERRIARIRAAVASRGDETITVDFGF
jgi:HEAT repeat protein